jgi:hypothetical protein
MERRWLRRRVERGRVGGVRRRRVWGWELGWGLTCTICVTTMNLCFWLEHDKHDRRSRKSPVSPVGVVIGEGSRKCSIVEYTERSRRVSEPEIDLTGRVGRC